MFLCLIESWSWDSCIGSACLLLNCLDVIISSCFLFISTLFLDGKDAFALLVLGAASVIGMLFLVMLFFGFLDVTCSYLPRCFCCLSRSVIYPPLLTTTL